MKRSFRIDRMQHFTFLQYIIFFSFALPVVSVTYRDNIFIYLLPYAIPLAQICLSGSCYSTIALTVERYNFWYSCIKKSFYFYIFTDTLQSVLLFFDFVTTSKLVFTSCQFSFLLHCTTFQDFLSLRQPQTSPTLVLETQPYLVGSSLYKKEIPAWKILS